MDIAVELKRVVKKYGNITVLNDITLSIPEGSIFGLVGPNGAGKTTLIKILSGALQPNSGEVRVLGLHPIKDKWKLREKLGYMPQFPAIYDDLTARENILFFGRAHKIEDLENKTNEILKFAEIPSQNHQLVRDFSGGMKKRVSLCCTLIHNPKIIILDEPTAAIDPYLKIESWKLFRKLAKSGATLIISTHIMEEALLCDAIAVLRAGKLIITDSPKRILEKGSTRINVTSAGKNVELTIDSKSDSLAKELQKFGLDSSISSLDIQAQNLEEIILSFIENASNQQP
jgi:ABC-2 type transport system ATP-binding protein